MHAAPVLLEISILPYKLKQDIAQICKIKINLEDMCFYELICNKYKNILKAIKLTINMIMNF